MCVTLFKLFLKLLVFISCLFQVLGVEANVKALWESIPEQDKESFRGKKVKDALQRAQKMKVLRLHIVFA